MKIHIITFVAAAAALLACHKTETETGSSSESTDSYPLTTCVVSGEELGSMGDPVVYDHNGITVKFCCKQCLPKFKKDPGTYVAKLQ